MVVKITHKKVDYYLIWSSVVDAPVTYGMTLDELKAYYKEECGNSGLRSLERDMQYIDQYGHNGTGPYSFGYYKTAKELMSHNRAGDNEKRLSYKGIIETYCLVDWRNKSK